jgi:hypothetical protein
MGREWTDLAQDRDRCWALVNGVINIRVPKNKRNFLTNEKLLASQDELCSMELFIE